MIFSKNRYPLFGIMLWPSWRRSDRDVGRGQITNADKSDNAIDDVRLGKKRRMALVRYLDQHEIGPARLHGGDRRLRQDIGVGAADHHQWHVGERVEFVPERRQGVLEIDAVER